MLSEKVYFAARLRHARFYSKILRQVGNAAENDDRSGRDLLEEHWLQIVEARNWLNQHVSIDKEACELSITYGLEAIKFLAMWGNLNDAIDWVHDSLDTAILMDDKLRQVRFFNEIARLYLMGRSHEKSHEAAEQALVLAREIDDKFGEGNALLEIGRLMNTKPALRQDAPQYFKDASELFKILNEEKKYARTLHSWGILKSFSGAFDEAHTLLEEAIAVFRKIDSQRYLASALARFGEVIEQNGNALLGRTYILEALDLARFLEDDVVITNCLLKLGINALVQNEYRTYYAYNYEAYMMGKAFGIQDYTALALSNMGNYHFLESEYHLAETYYSEAMAIYKAMAYQTKVLTAYGGIATTQAMQGKAESVWTILHENWEVAKSIDYSPALGCYLIAIAYLYALHYKDIEISLIIYATLREKGEDYYFIEEFETLQNALRENLGADALEAYYEKREAKTWDDLLIFAEELLEK